MEEQIVTFETAELAYLKGLPRFLNSGNDLSCYKISDKSFVYYHVHIDFPNKEQYLYAPTQSLLQKWLREKYKIHITIFSISQESWMYRITKPNQNLSEGLYEEDFESYEEALELSLQEALKLIE